MKTVSVILVLAALAASGCSTAVSPGKSTGIDTQKTGLVLVTVIKTGPDEATKYLNIEFPFRPVDHMDNPFKNPGINSSKELWLVEVPVGRYQIADWSWSWRMEVAEIPYQFDVRAGEITYIGRLEAAFVRVKNDQGHRRYTFVQPVLEDHHERALSVFKRQYPALASVPVRNAAPGQLFAWNPVRGLEPEYDFSDMAMNSDYNWGPRLVFSPKFPSAY